MKKKASIIFAILFFLIVSLYILNSNITFETRTSTSGFEEATIEYEQHKIKLSLKDSEYIRRIFNNKELYVEPYTACPFGYVSISFNSGLFSNTYYPATDECNIIKYKNKVFTISEKDNIKLRKMLDKYNVQLPRV